MIAAALALTPVLLFLVALLMMDSFKLVRPRAIAAAIAAGGAAALASVWLHPGTLPFSVSSRTIERVVAPLLEESLKSAFIVALVAGRRVGFPVDAAIQGFAVGTGFALAENWVYLASRPDAPALVWIVRGLGTAILHGAATGVFAIIAQRLSMRHGARAARAFLPGWIAAVAIHAAFNIAILPPVMNMLLLLLVVPLIVVRVFDWSERSTRDWVGAGLDLDVELLDLVTSEHFHETHFASYLQRLRTRFPGPVVADMFCLLRLQLELSAHAKGRLMARSAGLDVPKDADTEAALAEVQFLRHSIGRAGLLALEPLSATSDRDAWHGHVLRQ
ncbi:MAG TPA: PrsW family glutamic-type intramembrane protease [Vicinamibacterales bacterium]|nr:PrsW family glutamic-type intramembrane protease [Vicinamibacterales bacterium]